MVWSPGDFVSRARIDEASIKRYVAHQGQDSGQFRMALKP
jgi:hypothetical protein